MKEGSEETGRLPLIGQPEGQQLCRIVAAADRDHDVLMTVNLIRHRRPALGGWHVDCAGFRAGGLVISAQRRSARSRQSGERVPPSPAITSVFVTRGSDQTGPARARNAQSL